MIHYHVNTEGLQQSCSCQCFLLFCLCFDIVGLSEEAKEKVIGHGACGRLLFFLFAFCPFCRSKKRMWKPSHPPSPIINCPLATVTFCFSSFCSVFVFFLFPCLLVNGILQPGMMKRRTDRKREQIQGRTF
ncbi:hypothetical protein I7I50_06464 [Histoplasma capsulatum G186AR]|uniref:Uncharacterized protein n=1 Tax=Ajellomyces capsulatus TaxID=5037 RepID=A0A8H7Z2F1_AJECA|nr:hypothetical protein I7I52_10464 [Histoplasma capsulatum]QSS67401.1 hypothetical protein I7I50_06464 [Histoplasma capsulatum G186AR]